ncbi:hypothetical protein PFISCL1PPCAC_24951, partial [Pristionchus fissidentatus]
VDVVLVSDDRRRRRRKRSECCDDDDHEDTTITIHTITTQVSEGAGGLSTGWRPHSSPQRVLLNGHNNNGKFDASSDDRRLLARDSDIVDKAALARVIPRIPEPEIGDSSFVAAVLVFCATRPNAIRNHLEQLTRLRRNPARFPIVVSQDGDARDVAEAIDPFVKKAGSLFHIQHSKVEPTQKMLKSDKNYFFIAQHYKWALDHVFREMGYSHVIVTEDDLDMAEDFFSYFAAMKPLLEKDPSLWCVSAWNDNGGKDLTDRRDGAKLWRTDFFPGLGWMLRAEVWNELREHWPDRYWDDWMRSPSVRKGRSCVRPEISRTAHNMKLAGKGSSGGLYKSYLSSITLPDSPVDFSLVDTSELMKNNYDTHLAQALADAKAVESVPEEISTEHSYRVKYSNAREWRVLADRFKLMNDIRSGMTRTAYHGVVPFSWKGARIYAVPSWLDEKKLASGEIEEAAYDPRWDLQSKFMDFEKQYCKPTRFTGKCDPANPELREWFKRRNMLKKLDAWGEMVVV